MRALIIAVVIGVFAPVWAQDPDAILEVSSWTGQVGDEIEVPVLLTNTLGDVQGWSFGISHDPTVLDLTSVEMGSTTLTAGQGGGPPPFHSVTIWADGFTIGAVLSSHGSWSILPIGSDYEMEIGHYTILQDPAGSEICPVSTLGSPPFSTVVVFQGTSVPMLTFCGEYSETVFERGDCNADGSIDIGDPIFVEQYLFLSGADPLCLSACDTNDDGSLDIADSIYLLSHLFVGGATPPEPFPGCGLDATPDDLSCEAGVCP